MYPVHKMIEWLTEKIALFNQQVETFLMEVCRGRLQWLSVVCAGAAARAAACLGIGHHAIIQDSACWQDGRRALIVRAMHFNIHVQSDSYKVSIVPESATNVTFITKKLFRNTF